MPGANNTGDGDHGVIICKKRKKGDRRTPATEKMLTSFQGTREMAACLPNLEVSFWKS
jgi:hypothetical protein